MKTDSPSGANTTAGAAAGKTKKDKAPKTRDVSMIRAIILMFVDNRVKDETPMTAKDVEKGAFGRVVKETAADFQWLKEQSLIRVLQVGSGKMSIVLPVKREIADPYQAVASKITPIKK